MEKISARQAFLNFFKGLLIGAGAIAPGISGSSMAVTFGIYHQIIDVIAGLPKSIIKNFSFLLTVAIGLLSGLFLVALASKALIDLGFGMVLFFFFGGLMIGTVPMQAKTIEWKKTRWYDYLWGLGALTIALVLGLVAYQTPEGSGQITSNFFLLCLYGAVLGLGIIMPGISGATILIMVGVYGLLMDAVATFQIGVMVPVALGGVGIILALAFIIKKVITTYPRQFNIIVLGFIIDSIPIIFLNSYEADLSQGKDIIKFIIALLMVAIGYYVVMLFGRLDEKAAALK